MDLSTEDFIAIRNLIYERTGMHFGENKIYYFKLFLQTLIEQILLMLLFLLMVLNMLCFNGNASKTRRVYLTHFLYIHKNKIKFTSGQELH